MNHHDNEFAENEKHKSQRLEAAQRGLVAHGATLADLGRCGKDLLPCGVCDECLSQRTDDVVVNDGSVLWVGTIDDVTGAMRRLGWTETHLTEAGDRLWHEPEPERDENGDVIGGGPYADLCDATTAVIVGDSGDTLAACLLLDAGGASTLTWHPDRDAWCLST